MKIVNSLSPSTGAATTPAARRAEGAPEAFQALLEKQAGPPAGVKATLELTGSVLDVLERIAAQLSAGASVGEMAAAHEQLARQAGQLREAGEGLEPGPLKGVVEETAALSFLQLWRFERGELD
jgi:hypothetical protein